MNLHLTNKTAFITGSTAGIGLAIATKLAEEGAAVIVNGRSQERVDQAIRHILDHKPQIQPQGVVADFGKPESIENVYQEVPEVDILVNNVGIFKATPFEEISDDDWFKLFEVNVMSGVRLSRFYLPRMKRLDWGRIIFISSESGELIPTEMIHYGMTKTAQIAVARGIAQLTKGTDVTVNTVMPGPTLSEGTSRFLSEFAKERGLNLEEAEKEFFQSARPSSLIQRFATTEEVATMVAYVASPLSSATNGAALRVDGGTVPTIF